MNIIEKGKKIAMRDIFAMSDVHGNYPLFKAAIQYCERENPEYSLIFMGDACDRGPDGYKIMHELLDNPQVIYLKGNHEDMFVKAARFILNDYTGAKEPEAIKNYLYGLNIRDYYAPQVQDCLYNGGKQTLIDWICDGMSNEFVSRIAALPLTFSTDTMDFCHAGVNYKVFKRVADDEYEGEIPDKEDTELILWDRNYLGMGWEKDRICVYGHTPVYHLPSKYYGKDKSHANAHPCLYQGFLDDRWTGKKLNMDVGTYNTDKLYVLNCLTMKVQGFKFDKLFDTVEEIEVIQM